ncbi:serine/threonine protein kinase, partial [Myxococcota bacterium]|nr:serine/threonine protein kinase [Myxococcota bacterium]MBU1537767.1 serine/threonine protein kinase [Myxococcota bacterium]
MVISGGSKKSVPLGRYHLLELMALGTTAEVYWGKLEEGQAPARNVAIKKILPMYCDNEEFIRAMTVEARISSLIAHPSVVEVFEFNKSNDIYFIVMEMVEGKDLQSLLDKIRSRNKTVPVVEAAYITKNMLEGLGAAHAICDDNARPIQLIHRDVNPSNILLGYNGDVKICDFGIAKSTFSLAKTKAGIIKGKARYLSPEQAAGHDLDLRTDIFSAGIVLYELLTGKRIWDGGSDIEILKNAKSGKLPPFGPEWDEIPLRLQAVVKKALEPKPEDRYACAADFAKALGIFLKKEVLGYSRNEFASFMKEFFAQEILLDRARIEDIELVPLVPCESVDLISDDEWEQAHIGFSDFLSCDTVFPQEKASDTQQTAFSSNDTQVRKGKRSPADTQSDVRISQLNNEDTDQQKIDPAKLKASPVAKGAQKSSSEKMSIPPPVAENLQVMPVDRKMSGTKPLYNLSEEEQQAHQITEKRLEEELLGHDEAEPVLEDSNGIYDSGNEDTGDFIFTLGPFLTTDREKEEARDHEMSHLNKGVPKEDDIDYKGEFVINLSELKDDLEDDGDGLINDVDLEEIEPEPDMVTGGMIVMSSDSESSEPAKHSFIISLPDSDSEAEELDDSLP